MVWETEDGVWEVEKSVIRYGDITKEFEGEIKVEDVKKFAREHGLKKFIVKDSEENILTPEDFPRTGTIVIEEYNEAK